MRLGKYRGLEDLPDRLAVFPLPNALLLPRWNLPLQIFEPRYLSMIDAALTGNRLIGMIQPTERGTQKPELANIGTAGRITGYSETHDGRYEIMLSGIIRFKVTRELESTEAFRLIVPDFSDYLSDLAPPNAGDMPDRAPLEAAFRHYIKANNLDTDWDMVADADAETLINALACGAPFSDMERQALLEAPTLIARCKTLMALLKMDMPGGDSGTLQ